MAGFICNRVTGADAEARAFQGFTEIRRPLPDRESRVLGADPDKPGSGTCYRAYEVALAVRTGETSYKGGRSLYILMRHGGGVGVLALGNAYDGGAMTAALEAMPDRELYAILWTIWHTADTVATDTAKVTCNTWAQAFIDKRIKARRKARRATVEILPLYNASASYHGQPPVAVPGTFRTPEEAFAAAKAAHPDAGSYGAAPFAA